MTTTETFRTAESEETERVMGHIRDLNRVVAETLLEEANGDAEYDAAALRSALEEREGLRRALGPSIYTQLNHLLPLSRNDYWELSELKQRLDSG